MTACSAQSAAAREPLAGTAPPARSWIVVEQPGPWGRDAIADSPLPEAVRDTLRDAKGLGIGVLLARHPDRLDRGRDEGHHVWIACSVAGGVRLREGVLDDLSEIARWDMAALAAGSAPPFGARTATPLLLVCTHSRRDQCCAVHGRALLNALLATADPDRRDRVWECSHVGGHRFAAVTVTLPVGVVHGRRTPDQATAIWAELEAGSVAPDLMRGRTCFPAPLQAAEVAVRRRAGITGADDLDVLVVRADRAVPVDLGWPVPTGAVALEVRHRDGRAWHAQVHHEALTERRAESCGGEPEPIHAWVVTDLAEAPAWH